MNRKQLTYEDTGHTLLIDGDILVYRIGTTTNEETEDIAKLRMNSYIDEISYNGFCTDYKVYLTDGEGNFRKKLYPEYKANRKGEKPKHYDMLRQYLIDAEDAEVSWGQEADDLLGINQTEDTIIASIDKDLNMIPGSHYNFVTNTHYQISPEEGIYNFYKQLLMGDATDNIPGIKGIGTKRAEKLLAGIKDEEGYKQVVIDSYMTLMPHIEDITAHVNLIGSLLYIRRKPGEIWSL